MLTFKNVFKKLKKKSTTLKWMISSWFQQSMEPFWEFRKADKQMNPTETGVSFRDICPSLLQSRSLTKHCFSLSADPPGKADLVAAFHSCPGDDWPRSHCHAQVKDNSENFWTGAPAWEYHGGCWTSEWLWPQSVISLSPRLLDGAPVCRECLVYPLWLFGTPRSQGRTLSEVLNNPSAGASRNIFLSTHPVPISSGTGSSPSVY